jgi:hypothetical protein
MLEIKANHLPRSLKGTKSQAMISVKAITPPPPIPWTDRPTRMTVKFLATAATIAPTPKRTREPRMRGLRPKMWLKFPIMGWNTVLVSRKLVPDQKASIALPPRVCAMIGSATDSEVASRATMSVTMDSEVKATFKRHPGLKAGGPGALPDTCEEPELAGISLLMASFSR